MKVTVVDDYDNDRQGLYVEGVLVRIEHRTNARDVCDAVGAAFEYIEIDTDAERLPDELADIAAHPDLYEIEHED